MYQNEILPTFDVPPTHIPYLIEIRSVASSMIHAVEQR
jgi:hypothetical protein